jgi:ribonucleoside-diphosphate reductase alpha chain
VLTGGTNEKKEIKPSEAAQNLTPDASQRRKRPESLDGKTIKIKTGCGSLYVTLSVDEDGNPMEIFCRLGKSGGCASSNMEVYGRLISGWLRAGLSTEVLIRQLRGISCSNPAYVPGGRVLSCADAVGVALERYLAGQFGAVKPVSDDDDVSIVDSQPEDSMAPSFTHIAQKTGGCPECGGVLEYEGGCSSCKACGFSKCA